MKKEILTMQNIQYDLRRIIRGGIIATGICVALFLLFFVLFLEMLELNGPMIVCICFAIMPTFLFVMIIVSVFDNYKLMCLCKKPGRVVTDRLVGKEVKEYLSRARLNETHHLYFASYGEYEISDINYCWSELHFMNADMVYFHAECDDEFYLVLSKPHTGKILLAYNTKMFDYQHPQL